MIAALLVIAVASVQAAAAPPPPDLPVASPATGAPAPDAPEPDAAWWARFGAAELTALQEESARNNRDLAVARARLAQAQAQERLQRAPLQPQIAARASVQGNGCSGEGCRQFSDVSATALGLSASYEADICGERRDRLRAARSTRAALAFDRQALSIAVAASVARRYFAILALRRRIAIARENSAAITAILDVIRVRVKVGVASSLDLAREQAQVEGVQAQLSTLEVEERRAVFALAVLVGRTAEGFGVTGIPLDRLAVPAIDAGLPSDLLLRRPDLRAAEARLAAAHANLAAARAAFLPRLSLTGEGGLVSTMLAGVLHGPGGGLAIGGAVLQTVFDGGAVRARRDLAASVEQEYLAAYQGAALGAFAEVETALGEAAGTTAAEARLQAESRAAASAFAIAQLQYAQGATDLLNVLQAQQTLFQAQDELAQATVARSQALIHLYEAIGGGWGAAAADAGR